MLWPGLSSTYYDQIALWFYEENVTHLAMPGIAKAHLTWNSVKASGVASDKEVMDATEAYAQMMLHINGDPAKPDSYPITEHPYDADLSTKDEKILGTI